MKPVRMSQGGRTSNVARNSRSSSSSASSSKLPVARQSRSSVKDSSDRRSHSVVTKLGGSQSRQRSTSNMRTPLSGRSLSAVGRSTEKDPLTPRRFAASQNRLTKGGFSGSKGSLRLSGRGSQIGSKCTKDTRPLTEKLYQQTMVRNMLDFLRANHYPNEALTSRHFPLSTKEFMNIFNFLYSFLNPANPGSLDQIRNEDRIIQTLRGLLKYPGQINRSDLITMNSLHSWPRVLGALSYLCEVVKLECKVEENITQIVYPSRDEDGFSTERESGKKLKWLHIFGCYNLWLQEYDEFIEQKEEYRRSLMDNEEINLAVLDQLQDSYQRIVGEIEKLEKEPDRLLEAKNAVLKKQEDLERMVKHIASLKKKKSTQMSKEGVLRQQAEELSAEILKKEEELNSLKESGVNPKVNSQLVIDKRRRIEQMNQELENWQKDIWNLEVEFYRKVEKVEKICRDFNSICIELQQVCGEEYLTLPLPGLSEANVTQNPVVDQIQEYLEEEVRERKLKNNAATEEIKQLEKMLDVNNENLVATEKRCEEYQVQLKTEEETHQELKHRFEKEEAALDRDLADLKQQHQQLRVGGQNERDDLKREIEELKEQLRLMKEKHANRIQEGDEFIKTVTEKAKNYVLTLQEKKEKKWNYLHQQRKARAAAVKKAMEEVDAMQTEVEDMVRDLEKED